MTGRRAWLLAATCLAVASPARAERWAGVDEAVVGKIAQEHGRGAQPLLPQAEGDLQLFLFLIAGAIGGFAAGYAWRMLVSESRRSSSSHREDTASSPGAASDPSAHDADRCARPLPKQLPWSP